MRLLGDYDQIAVRRVGSYLKAARRPPAFVYLIDKKRLPMAASVAKRCRSL